MKLPLSIQPIADQLINHKIDYNEAYDLIKSLPKPWHRAEWKKQRNKLIKESCEKCGKSDGTMVLQHTIHPHAYSKIKMDVMQTFMTNNPSFSATLSKIRNHAYYQALSKVVIFSKFSNLDRYSNRILDSLDLPIDLSNDGTTRKCCPECQRLVTDRHFRKTWSKYKCEAGHIFEQYDEIIYYKKYRTKDKQEAQRTAKLNILREAKYEIDKQIHFLQQTIDNEIGKTALFQAFQQHELYMSMEHTKTYCKSCAYKEDLEKGLIK